MRRSPPSLVYVGIKSQVIAFNRSTGQEIWRAKLQRSLSGGSYVHVYRDTQYVYALTGGKIWCLEPATGSIIWHDPMKGLGTDLASVTSDSPLGPPSVPIEPAMQARNTARTAAAAS